MKFEIVTDSCANLAAETVEGRDIRIIPVVYKMGGVERLSFGRSAPYEAKRFYGLLRRRTRFTESCAAEEDCVRLLESMLRDGSDILYIGVSSEINGTFKVVSGVAETLRVKYPERKIYCVDSLCASLGQGKLAVEAADMRAVGLNLNEVYSATQENKLRIEALITAGERPYGRSPFKKLAGTFNLKRVTQWGAGKRTAEKVLGRKRALKVLARRAAAAINENKGQTVYIGHGDNAAGAAYLIERINSLVCVKDYVVNYFDMTLGGHFGPGTVAVFFTTQRV